MWAIWEKQLLPRALISCPKSNKSPNLVTLPTLLFIFLFQASFSISVFLNLICFPLFLFHNAVCLTHYILIIPFSNFHLNLSLFLCLHCLTLSFLCHLSSFCTPLPMSYFFVCVPKSILSLSVLRSYFIPIFVDTVLLCLCFCFYVCTSQSVCLYVRHQERLLDRTHLFDTLILYVFFLLFPSMVLLYGIYKYLDSSSMSVFHSSLGTPAFAKSRYSILCFSTFAPLYLSLFMSVWPSLIVNLPLQFSLPIKDLVSPCRQG